jgi:hypothetical protein
MAVQTLPLDYELVVYSGTNYRREFRWLPDGVTPMDFTGWTAIMPIGSVGATASLLLSSTNGGVTLSAAGQIVIELSPAQSTALPAGVTYYNLDLTDTNGYVRRFLRGRISVIQDVKAS